MSKEKSKQLLIYDARLITSTAVINKAWLLISRGKIQKLGKGRLPVFNGVGINVQGSYLAPGFIDLHIHGDINKISNTQLRYGTTGFLCGLHTDSVKGFCKKIDQAKNTSLWGAQCLGFHLEGPFINKKMAGAQPKRLITEPDVNKLKKIIKYARNDIKIVTLACELKRGIELIRILKANNIVIGLGHTNATIEQAEKAVYAGARYATHVFNRMSGISARVPGVITQVLLDDRISAEVIADGEHVHPALLKLLSNNKSVNDIVLVTDSVAAMDMHTLKKIKGIYRMENFTIAGSNLNMAKAVKNMVHLCGVRVIDAVKMASTNPARILGLENKKGKIKEGFDADIVVFDDNFKVEMTVVGGKILNNKFKR